MNFSCCRGTHEDDVQLKKKLNLAEINFSNSIINMSSVRYQPLHSNLKDHSVSSAMSAFAGRH